MAKVLRIDDLRRYAVARSLFGPTTLSGAIQRMGFVQADPIRSPARAQDLVLRHRVNRYGAGDLEEQYKSLPIEEDYFINYGFVTRTLQNWMMPRCAARTWDRSTKRRADEVRRFVLERGEVHPREVDKHFSHGKITNYWGGSSSASTRLLEEMHYRGLLRVSRRLKGVRVYAVREQSESAASLPRADCAKSLVSTLIDLYAPLPAKSAQRVVSMLRLGAPHLSEEIRAAWTILRNELATASLDGQDWFWPAHEDISRFTSSDRGDEQVRFLAPFDPIVWDRFRFELFWGWAYRFEAYTPVAKRKWGYYALPLLWHDEVIGWGNFSITNGSLVADIGYVNGKQPKNAVFKTELLREKERMREFLRLV